MDTEVPPRVGRAQGTVRNAFANGLSRAVSVGTALVLTPIVLHAVGAESFGLWILIGSIIGYGSLLNLGIGGAITKYVAQHRIRGETAEARATIGAALRLYLTMGSIVALGGLALAPVLPHLVNVPPELASLTQVVAALMAIGLGTAIACSTSPAILRGLQRYDIGAAIAIITSLVSALATVVALALGWGLIGIVALAIPMPVLTQLLASWAIHRIAPELALAAAIAPPGSADAPNAAAEERSRVTRRLLGFSWPLLVIDLAGMLQSRTDEIVVGVALSLGTVAPYALARRLSSVPRMLAEQFVVLLLPLASELDAVSDRDRLRNLYLTGVRVSLAIAMPLTGCLLILAGPIVEAWVGPGFESSAPIVAILAIAAAIDLSLWPAGFVLQGINRHRWIAPIALASGLANLGLSLALAHPFGIVGIALGTLVPTAVEAVLLVTPFTLLALGIGSRRFLREALVPALGPLVAVLLVLAVAIELIPPASGLAILVLVAIAHVIYGALYLATPAAAPERRLANDLLRSLRPAERVALPRAVGSPSITTTAPTGPTIRSLASSLPKVSVVIPCFGQAQYLGDAVESVVGQTFADWETVIVDDGSPDDTATVAEDLIARYPDRRIRLVRQANGGLAAARNAGIAASSGRYILPLDADDILLPEMLAKTVEVLDAEPRVAIAYTDQRQFGAISRIVKTADWDPDLQRRRNLFAATALFRREVWDAVGGYDPAMRDGYEDWDFWLGAAERGFVGRRIPEALFGYRIKASSMHVTARAGHRDLVEQIRAKHPEWYASSWRRWWRWPIRASRRLRHVIGAAFRAAGR